MRAATNPTGRLAPSDSLRFHLDRRCIGAEIGSLKMLPQTPIHPPDVPTRSINQTSWERAAATLPVRTRRPRTHAEEKHALSTLVPGSRIIKAGPSR